jgi:hypothetical protein
MMGDSDTPFSLFTYRLNFEKIRQAVSRIEDDAADRAQEDAKEASDLHVAFLEGEINTDTAELNSPWCDLLRTDSDSNWRFEAIWQAVQHHLSRVGLYPAGDEQEAQLYTGFACQLSTLWLSTYSDSKVIPSNVASKTRGLYEEDDFRPIFSAWYEVGEN